MAKIDYTDKVTLISNPVAEINKVTASNMNAVKNSVNWLYDEQGVIIYADTVNDVNNKQTLTASQDNVVTIVDASPDRTQAPISIGSSELWAGNKITPFASGDSYIIRLDFQAEIDNLQGYFSLKVDIDGAVGDIFERVQSFPKGANTAHGFSSTNYIFCRDTFFANGGSIEINPSHTMLIWDKVITIHRLYGARS